MPSNQSSGSGKQSGRNDLSEAAEKMRTGKTEQERSEGASEMGRAGGKQSHKND